MRRGVWNFARTGLVGATFRPSSVRGTIGTVIVLVDRTRRASLQQLDKLVKKHATFLIKINKLATQFETNWMIIWKFEMKS